MENLPEPWNWLPENKAREFETELAREIGLTHPLACPNAQCLAKRDRRDDFLFRLPNGPKPLAVVYLTWSVEKAPDFPWTTFFDSYEDFFQNWRRIFD